MCGRENEKQERHSQKCEDRGLCNLSMRGMSAGGAKPRAKPRAGGEGRSTAGRGQLLYSCTLQNAAQRVASMLRLIEGVA